MSASLVNGKLLTDRNFIRDMWADHFEALGTPSENEYFDNTFLNRVVSGVREIFDSCTNNPFGVLCEPLDYDEVACVCSKLKLGVTGLCIDYEHIHCASPPVWRLLFELYQNFYANGSVCESLKTGVILPLFEGNYIGSFSSNVEDNIDKIRKKAVHLILIIAKLTSSFGAKHFCPPYCMALSSLLLHHLYLQNLNDVSNVSSKIFSMYQISLP